MKPILIAACLASIPLAPVVSAGQMACPVVVPANVEVAEGTFSLADLLGPDTCRDVRRAASGLRLGEAPLAGSVRVLDGRGVRQVLQKMADDAAARGSGAAHIVVPPRIAVRLAGARLSCAEIGAQILSSFQADSLGADFGPATKRSSEVPGPKQVDCGATDHILRGTPLAFTKPVWNSGRDVWDVAARCVDPADCVPFLVRLQGSDAPDHRRSDLQGGGGNPRPTRAQPSPAHRTLPGSTERNFTGRTLTGHPLVRPGERVTLLWEQDGIRLVGPAVCLDAGELGQGVRARITGSGRTIPTIVVSVGQLRAL